jgi:hypothetical protein
MGQMHSSFVRRPTEKSFANSHHSLAATPAAEQPTSPSHVLIEKTSVDHIV